MFIDCFFANENNQDLVNDNLSTNIMNNTNLDLNKLLLKVAEDDRQAFNTFYNIFYHQVFRFSYYYLKESEACKEVVSDIFVSVWKSRTKLTEISNIEVYLFIVAKNASLNYLRKSSSGQFVPIEDIPMNMVPSEESAESNLLSDEMNKHLTEIVNKLPEKCRIIFLMARQEGMQTKEIAEALGITESTVRGQIKISINKIMEQMLQLYPNLRLSKLLFLLFFLEF